MSEPLTLIIQVVLIGIGATIVMDFWALLLKRLLNIPPLNWAMVGRWIGHFPRGQFSHENIASSPAVFGELVMGWFSHYLIGILFSAFLVIFVGENWIHKPTLLPAMVFGLISVVCPFFIMQPGLGAGIAASKTPTPNKARTLSLLAHSMFGLGLYATALLLINI